jgi:uncharacterized membrane protein YphA (DoxX/SURF4 family)
MQSKKLVSIILRVSLAFAFIYPAVSAVLDPSSWIGYFPPFLLGYIPDMVLLHSFGAAEVILALWLLWGWKAQIPAAVMALILLAIVVFNTAQFEITFRDLSIMGMAIALIFISSGKSPRRSMDVGLDAR